MASNIIKKDQIKGLNALSMALSKHILVKQDGNTIYSPFGILSAVSAILLGLKGKSFEDIKSTLKLDKDLDVNGVLEHILKLLKEITNKNGGSTLIQKNIAMSNQKMAVKNDHINLLKDKLQMEMIQCDFQQNAESEAEKINDLIAQASIVKIKELLSADILKQATSVVLGSAFYLKTDWLLAFNKDNNVIRTFHCQDGTTSEVVMMFDDMNTNYALIPELQCSAVKLRLSYSRFKMMFVLPDTNDGLPALIDKLFVCEESNANFGKLLDSHTFEKRTIEVYLPKFKISQKSQFSETLKEMGTPLNFNDRKEFFDITDAEQLSIDEIIQQTVFEVNEEGSEKASASAIVYWNACHPPIKSSLPVFRADHPFLFALLNADDTVVFLGRMSDPSQCSV